MIRNRNGVKPFMFRLSLMVLLWSAVAGNCDIPERTASWNSFRIISSPGDDHIIDCTRESDYSTFHSIVINSSENNWNWSLLSLDRYGNQINRTVLLTDTGSLEHWFTSCFVNGNTLVAVYGSRLGPGRATLVVVDCSSPEEFSEVQLSGPLEVYQEIAVTSISHVENNSFLIAGAGYSESSGNNFFTAEVRSDGTIERVTELPQFMNLQLEDTSIQLLSDRSFLLSFQEDAFTSGIDVARFDSEGEEMWKAFIGLESEFTAVINDFLELENGDILCAGVFDQMGQMALRGQLVLFDPSLSEIWRRTDWYSDQTEFQSIQLTENGDILCAGWTAVNDQMPFTVTGMNVLIAFVDPEGGGLEGISIEEDGNQRPGCVFEGGIGEYFVIGDHTPETGDESNIFFGRISLNR